MQFVRGEHNTHRQHNEKHNDFQQQLFQSK